MPYDEYKEDVHLTPSGWVYGTFSACGTVTEKPAPVDRVLTLHKSVYQGSGYSPENVTWEEAWRSSDVSDVYIKELKAKFPLEQPPIPKKPKLKPLKPVSNP